MSAEEAEPIISPNESLLVFLLDCRFACCASTRFNRRARRRRAPRPSQPEEAAGSRPNQAEAHLRPTGPESPSGRGAHRSLGSGQRQ
jgi:hypothetical protein